VATRLKASAPAIAQAQPETADEAGIIAGLQRAVSPLYPTLFL